MTEYPHLPLAATKLETIATLSCECRAVAVKELCDGGWRYVSAFLDRDEYCDRSHELMCEVVESWGRQRASSIEGITDGRPVPIESGSPVAIEGVANGTPVPVSGASGRTIRESFQAPAVGFQPVAGDYEGQASIPVPSTGANPPVNWPNPPGPPTYYRLASLTFLGITPSPTSRNSMQDVIIEHLIAGSTTVTVASHRVSGWWEASENASPRILLPVEPLRWFGWPDDPSAQRTYRVKACKPFDGDPVMIGTGASVVPVYEMETQL